MKDRFVVFDAKTNDGYRKKTIIRLSSIEGAAGDEESIIVRTKNNKYIINTSIDFFEKVLNEASRT